MLNEIIKNEKFPLSPYIRPKGRNNANKGEYFYNKVLYVFDKINNHYKCPMGKFLEYKGINRVKMLSYKSNSKDCVNCGFKGNCTNQKWKEIQRHLLENAKDYAREIRLSEYEKSLYPFWGLTFLKELKKQRSMLCFFACLNLKNLFQILWDKGVSCFKIVL